MGSEILQVSEAAKLYLKAKESLSRHIEKVNISITNAAHSGKTFSLTTFADKDTAHIVADRYSAAGYQTSVSKELNISNSPINLKVVIPDSVIESMKKIQ